jgi:SAM-dependent methyltransferase
MTAAWAASRDAWLRRLGIEPSLRERLATILEATIGEAERRAGDVAVLDAGCGHRSPLRPFRPRIARLVGVDLDPPPSPLPYLDELVILDLCQPGAGVPEDSFDVVLSNFTLEHFADPRIAIANLERAMRPGARLVLVTVNRRHPFVAAYLGLPGAIRDRLQRVLKSSPSDAHRLVGRCNDPRTITSCLQAAGFEDIQLQTVSNLARAWGRRRATFALGLVGDRLFERTPGRRSTIIATARKAGVP